MGPRASVAFVVATMAVMGGCDGADTVARTQIMLVVDADSEVRTRAERLRVWVRGSRGAEQAEPMEHAFGEGDPLAWPTQVAVVPRDGDASRTFEAVVTAEDADGPFVMARVLSGFVAGQVRSLPLLLEGACVDVTCDEGETCMAGACVDAGVDPDDLDPYDPDDIDDPRECDPDVSCGLCDLGRPECDPDTDEVLCNDVDLPNLEAASVECDSTVEASTFLFLDPDAVFDEAPDGSRARPFRAVDDALAAAEGRGAAAVVIGGAPTFHDPLQVVEGVSILGGYTAAPEFLPDARRRPRWRVGSEHFDGARNQLVGARAANIQTATVLRHLVVTTSSVADRHDGKDGASNIAFRATDAPGLWLEDVVLEAGAAGAGVDGADGVQPTEAMDGGPASGRTPGQAPPACATTCTVDPDVQVEGQDSHACGLGGDGYATDPLWADALAGNPGSSNGDVPGGEGGSSWYDTSQCGVLGSTATEGQPGADGQDGAPGGPGHPRAGGSFDVQGAWQAGAGGHGEPGERGTWGGGGGAGGTVHADCINEPNYGGHGAGGGGPGCGGASGEGGGGGGASVGLLALRSGGFTLVGGAVHAGDGGDGGAGGSGAAGGSGGPGGDEAVVEALCTEVDEQVHGGCHRLGGPGGNGGDGGHGGDGAGGAGGDSVALVCIDGAVTWGSTVLSAADEAAPGGDASRGELGGEPGRTLDQLGCH